MERNRQHCCGGRNVVPKHTLAKSHCSNVSRPCGRARREPHSIRFPPPAFLDNCPAGSTTPPESSDRLHTEERRIRATALGNPPRDLQCGQPSGTPSGTFPSMFRRCCWRYAAHAFSSARVSSFGTISNRASARIKARTLTWGSAAGPVTPHLRQVTIGVWIFRPTRIRCSISSSSSRRLMSAGIDNPATARPFPETKFSAHRPRHF